MPRSNISVIVPTHNRPHLLPRAVASVLDQKWPGTEVIVIDDGSLVPAAESLGDLASQVRLIRHPAPLGVSRARNAGIEAAQGEIIAFLDDDDWQLSGYLCSVSKLFGDFPQVGFCWVSREVTVQQPNGTFVEEIRRERASGPFRLAGDLHNIHLGFSHGVAVRTAHAQAAGGLDPTMRYAEDYDFLVRLVAVGSLPGRVSEIVFHHNESWSGGLSHTASSRYRASALLRVRRKNLAFLEQRPGAADYLVWYAARVLLRSGMRRRAWTVIDWARAQRGFRPWLWHLWLNSLAYEWRTERQRRRTASRS